MAKVPPRSEPPPAPLDARPTWREELVGWARAVATGVVDRGAPRAPALDTLIARFELPVQLVPVLALLYGAHLAGERGAAPIDVARVLGKRWDEALGRGELAARGLARYVESRVILAAPIQRMLDELPVASGELIGVPGELSLLGPCVVIAGDTPLRDLAVRYLAQVGGAILAAHADADLGDVFLEARARGVAPMLRIDASDVVQLGTDPAVLVVPSDAAADQLGVPRL